jgi:catechol 2,3-dioxygenase-like lactoylglutathione lyase family enzyme
MTAKTRPRIADLQLTQLALNTVDLSATLRLYWELFGFSNAGGSAFWGELARVQGLEPDAHCIMWWMVGAQPFFQLELFHHTEPKQQRQPADWRPSDHGWVRFGVAVQDFDRVARGLAKRGVPVLGETGSAGTRRLAFRDPQAGAIVEVREAPANTGPTVIYVACSVPDVAHVRRLYEEVLGAPTEPLDRLHAPEDEALWGLAGAEREGFLVRLGETFLEIVSYSRPAGRPKPAGAQIVDQGIMNVGVGSRDPAAIRDLIREIQAAGLKITIPVDGEACGTYVVEPHFEIELMGVPAALDKTYGFKPAGRFVAEFDLANVEAEKG